MPGMQLEKHRALLPFQMFDTQGSLRRGQGELAMKIGSGITFTRG